MPLEEAPTVLAWIGSVGVQSGGIKIDSQAFGLSGWSCHLLRQGSLVGACCGGKKSRVQFWPIYVGETYYVSMEMLKTLAILSQHLLIEHALHQALSA